jgi:hypothetical protein
MEPSAAPTRTPGTRAEASQATPSAPKEHDGCSAGTLRFDIARLTLPWISGTERMRFKNALEAELQRLGDKRGSPVWTGPTHTRIERLDFGESQASASPEDLACHIARQLTKKITGLWGIEPDV